MSRSRTIAFRIRRWSSSGAVFRAKTAMARSEIQAWLEALTRKTKPNSVGGIPPDASEPERSSTGGDHHRLRSAFTATIRSSTQTRMAR